MRIELLGLILMILGAAKGFELVPEFHIMENARMELEENDGDPVHQNIRASLIMIGASVVAAIAASTHDWAPLSLE